MAPSTPVSPFRFRDIAVCPRPYPHFQASDFLATEWADLMLGWLSEKAHWQPRKLDGYAGYCDISLQYGDLPRRLNALLELKALSELRVSISSFFQMDAEGYVRVTAHRLLTGGSLKPHCDLAPLKFTHRLLIHLNRGWTRENGGLLCVFDGDPAAKKRTKQKLILPAHRSAFAFEISNCSFHAVTPVVTGERYTLSYTFYPPSAKQS